MDGLLVSGSRRIKAAAVAFLALVSLAACSSPSSEPPATAPKSGDIFAQVKGWIAYGDNSGIWALDAANPGHPEDQIRLSERRGDPLAWSSDGSKLLIRRGQDLSILNADGSETALISVEEPTYLNGGAFAPDGSRVVYATQGKARSAIYLVDAEGGEPEVLLGRPHEPHHIAQPAFSPDGKQIAYFDGGGDHDNRLWVMNADGSGVRALTKGSFRIGHINNLAWSPDGSHLAFSGPSWGDNSIWVVGSDGSGLTEVIRYAVNPQWSLDGSRISYQRVFDSSGALGNPEIAGWDGTHVQKFGYGGSGPWTPFDPRT
jgi:dipeptidyl aminopeptidase/acylaminoacyl peptidase